MLEQTNTAKRSLRPAGTLLASGAVLALLALTVSLGTTGCATPKNPESNRMASIIVTNESSEHIEQALRAVFKKHSYEEGRAEEDEMVFQKPGSMVSGVVYGDWYSGGVWERIKVYQRELENGRTLIECDGYMVQEHEDPLFQHEKREYGTKKGHLRKVLDEVAAELKRTPAPAASPH